MVRLVKYQVDGGGTTVVEDSGGDLLRAIGGESESSSSSSNKKRVYSNANANDSSGEPSKTPSNARGVVLTLRNVNGNGRDFIFTSQRSVVYPQSTDSCVFSLSQSQHNNVLAFTVLTTHPNACFVTPNFGILYPDIDQKLCIKPRHNNAIRCDDGVKFLIRITELDESTLKTAEQIFRGNSNVTVKEDLWNIFSTNGSSDIKLSWGGSVSTGIGNGGALEERANKRTKLDGESVVNGEVNDVGMGEVNDVGMGGGGDRKGAPIVGCGIDLFMDVLNGSDLASYLTVTDLCNVSLSNTKCYQAMKKKLSDESAWDCDHVGCDEQFSDYEEACEHEKICKYRKKDPPADGSGGGSGAAVSSSCTTLSTSSALAPSVPPKQTKAPKKVRTSTKSSVSKSSVSKSSSKPAKKKKKANPSSSKVAHKPTAESKVSSKATLSTLTKSKPAPVTSTKSSASTSEDAIASLLLDMETNPDLNTNLSSGTVSFVTDILREYDVEGMDGVFDEDNNDHITRAAKYHKKNPHMKRPDLLRDFCKVEKSNQSSKLVSRLKTKTKKLYPNFQMDNKQAKAMRAKAKSVQATKKKNRSESASSRKRSAEIITGIGK